LGADGVDDVHPFVQDRHHELTIALDSRHWPVVKDSDFGPTEGVDHAVYLTWSAFLRG
jgi:hypothetical protein